VFSSPEEEEYHMVVFGGLVPEREGSFHRTSSNDMWRLRITNTTYEWEMLTPEGLLPEHRYYY